MNLISGLVLVKETGICVPNLVVAVFDPELTLESAMQQDQALELVRRTGPVSSVLTDSKGRFVIKISGKQERPNLVIAVFAPEDVQSVDKPFPLPPEQRLMYLSTVPRVDAAVEQASFIRVLQDQLDKFQISPASHVPTADANVNLLHSATEHAYSFNEEIKKRLTHRVRTEQVRVARIRRKAKQKVKSLSGIPMHLRDGKLVNNQLLIMDRRDLATDLKKRQDASIKEGMARLAKRKPKLRLTLSQQDLTDLGLHLHDKKLTGKAKSKKLIEKTTELIGAVDLVRRRGLNNPSADELVLKYLTPVPPLPKPPPQGSDGRMAIAGPVIAKVAPDQSRRPPEEL